MNYCCPVNIFKSFINQYLSQYKPPLISSLTGSLMRIKLLGRRRQWFLEKGEDCLSERSERVPQPQKPSASAAVKKAPMRRALWYFLSAQKVRNPSVTLYDKNYLQISKINRTVPIALWQTKIVYNKFTSAIDTVMDLYNLGLFYKI